MAGGKRMVAKACSTMAETLAMRWALTIVGASRIQDIEAESDSKVLVDGSNGKCCPNIHEELILQDIQLLADNIGVQSFQFVNRNANRVAHQMAHHISTVNSECIWIEEVSTDVEFLIADDARLLPP
ncbi:conserved hypothetical protein [Ricinus communis]|uniref:RNase H type-1 domain-containing protein n=1 Tax=Ricinus communis TaxID=3988 RepID=B9SLI1_RICCO|nr:conserved hypothetical protein [Ricinus communis]